VGHCMDVLCGLQFVRQCDDHLTIKTDKGKIHGKLGSDGQIRVFLGVPYAAAPVGPLRWEAAASPA